MAAYRQNPNAGVSWAVAEAEIRDAQSPPAEENLGQADSDDSQLDPF